MIEVCRLRSSSVVDGIAAVGMKHSEDAPNAHLVWWDGLPPIEEFANRKATQMINKIPNMELLCNKATLFQALNQMQTLFPIYYGFFPRTFALPHQFNELCREHVRLRGKCDSLTWIVKPQNGCCGSGIRLIQNPFDIVNETAPAVIQQYIPPFLLNGFKFDFRFYILISDLQPLTVFIYNEGIARFCTKKYRKPKKGNLKDCFRHITNTAINVENTECQESNFTRPASDVLREIDKDSLWPRIKTASMLTILSLYPQIAANVAQATIKKNGIDPMHRYFQILGIDVMLTDTGDPIVLELNDRPSMKATFQFEGGLKRDLVADTLRVVKPQEGPRNEPQGGWEKMLPVDMNSGMTKVMRTVQHRALSSFGVKTPMPGTPTGAKQIVYPKPVPDKLRMLMKSYRSHTQ